MPVSQLRNVNFGQTRANVTGSTGVGYTVMNHVGTVVIPRTTSGVYQLTSGSGLYAAFITFPDSFRGQVLWDCPAITGSGGNILSQSFATEQYNYEENNPKVDETWQMVNDVTGAINMLYDMQFGRWHIVNNQMLFYGPDNSTLLAVFNLFDDNGNPTMDAVFQRVKI
jgi:hypothetical protein